MSTETQIDTQKLYEDAVVAFENGYFGEAWDASTAIESLLTSGELSDKAEIEKFTDIKLKLDLMRLATCSSLEFHEILDKHILDALSIPDYDLVGHIGQRLNRLTFPEDQAELLETMQKHLEKSELLLGDQPIQHQNGKVKPTIANWIIDYNNAPGQGAQRGDLDELAYVNKSKNTQLLDPEGRKKLLTILKIYDAVRNQLVEYNKIPVVTEKDFNQALEGLYNHQIAKLGLTDEDDSGVQDKKVPEVPPSKISERTIANPNLQDLLNPETQTEEQLAMTKRTSGVFVASPVKASPAASQAKPVLEAVPEVKQVASSAPLKSSQVDIDKKLAELRSRAGIK